LFSQIIEDASKTLLTEEQSFVSDHIVINIKPYTKLYGALPVKLFNIPFKGPFTWEQLSSSLYAYTKIDIDTHWSIISRSEDAILWQCDRVILKNDVLTAIDTIVEQNFNDNTFNNLTPNQIISKLLSFIDDDVIENDLNFSWEIPCIRPLVTVALPTSNINFSKWLLIKHLSGNFDMVKSYGKYGTTGKDTVYEITNYIENYGSETSGNLFENGEYEKFNHSLLTGEINETNA